MAFLVSVSDNIQYISIYHLERKTKGNIIKTLNKIKQTYNAKNFVISDIYANNEFDSEDINLAMRPSVMHLCAANEHVPQI